MPTRRWWIAFSLLILAVHEAHELVHVLTGRALCGIWAERDFNRWWFTTDCATVWPTVAGPLFSYALMFLGAALALRTRERWMGIALLFAANPFARLFTAMMGGGDEGVIGRHIAGVTEKTPAVHAAVLVVVAALCGTVIAAGWRAMAGTRRRVLWFLAALIWPMVLTGTLLFVIGNRLLGAGVLAEPKVAGAPMLVVVVTVVVFALSAGTARWLRAE